MFVVGLHALAFVVGLHALAFVVGLVIDGGASI
jgi:hypothetical protein